MPVRYNKSHGFYEIDIRWPGHPRKRMRSPVQTLRGARQYEQQLLKKLSEGGPLAAAPRLSEFEADFMAWAKTRNKPSEINTKLRHLRLHIMPALGHLRLDQIGPEQIDAFTAAQVEAGYQAKTVNNHLMVLSKILRLAEERGKITRVPRMRPLKTVTPETNFLSFDEAPRLVAGSDAAWRTMIFVDLRTGLRLGELKALRWLDIDFERAMLRVTQNVWQRAVDDYEIGTPKSNKPRDIPLGPEVLAALKAHRHLRGPLVFCDENGGILTNSACEWAIGFAARTAGLPHAPTKRERRLMPVRPIGQRKAVTWHTLRHTFASHLVMRGAPLKAVQELLGHSTIQMTMRYAHLSPDARREAVRLLEYTAESAKSGDAVLETSGRRE